MTITKKQQTGTRITLRMSDDLYAEIQSTAARQCIPMSAEIIARLQAGPAWASVDEVRRLTAQMESMQRQILELLQG